MFRRNDFEGSERVMPAQAGIQGKQVVAYSSPAWIPAFAGMTNPRFTSHLHCVGLLVVHRTEDAGLSVRTPRSVVPWSSAAKNCVLHVCAVRVCTRSSSTCQRSLRSARGISRA